MLRFDATTQRYRAPDGRFVSRLTVIEARQSIVAEVSRQVTDITNQLKDGAINVADWQAQMRQAIRAGHTLAFGIASGGKAATTQSDWGRLGVILREEYKYLDRYAIAIANGAPIHLGRARMYALAIRGTFVNQEAQKQKAIGKLFARWVRTANESCPGCETQSSLGVRLLDVIPRIGSQQCLSHCKCYLSYE